MNSLFSLRCLRSAAPQITASPAASQPSTILRAIQQSRSFSSTPVPQKRNRGGPKKDARIQLIRYFLSHPLTPRPLRFSRDRYLRHWTIHRAWQVYKAQQRTQHERDLERQYQSMREACEALRLMDSAGNIVKEGEAAAQGKNVGRLYRIAMMKNDIWGGVPIEYARIQTDSPSTDGWNYGWTR
ncbi:hypothetical protein M436DRAFT_54952 [Aureobasidium namibiae CBS 147.97]|uniref:Large ribosomal subunit protein mL40 n=1 Tax=Aureobasidium namibiae CBS 147.97 TaxID=1043004 RepID=A0A074WAC1_9PEZI